MTYQIAMENDETNIKVERISLLMRTELFMYFYIKNYIGTQGEVRTVKDP